MISFPNQAYEFSYVHLGLGNCHLSLPRLLEMTTHFHYFICKNRTAVFLGLSTSQLPNEKMLAGSTSSLENLQGYRRKAYHHANVLTAITITSLSSTQREITER